MADLGTAVSSGAPATAASDSGSSSTTSAAATPVSSQAFAAAFAREESPASPPSDPHTTTPAAVQPGAEPGSTEERSPFIPRARFDEVNTRKGQLETELQQLAWAKAITPEQYQQVAQWVRRLDPNGDPLPALQEYLTELQQHPTHGARLKSLAAKALSARQPKAPESEPGPDLVWQMPDGKQVPIYSAEQQAKREQWAQSRWNAQMEQRLSPLQQAHQQLQAERQAVQQQAAVESYVSTTYQDAQTWPGMNDPATRKAVADELARASVPSDDPRDVSLALHAAWRTVVLPRMAQHTESALLTKLQTQAAGAIGVNPGSAAPSSSRPVTKFSDLGPEAW